MIVCTGPARKLIGSEGLSSFYLRELMQQSSGMR